MPRLRRSNQGVTPEGLHGGSTSGANLSQDATGICILYLASCIGTVGGFPTYNLIVTTQLSEYEP